MPRMIVVAGPPGGGKSTQLGPDYFLAQRIPYFNIDDRCKELHGSSKGIPVHIRNQANADLRQFCTANFTAQATFAYETTLRKPFAIEQSGLARAATASNPYCTSLLHPLKFTSNVSKLAHNRAGTPHPRRPS